MSNTTLRRKKHRNKNIKSSKTSNTSYHLEVKSKKKGNKIVFEVWQTDRNGQTGRIQTFAFRKDAKHLADFHNENQPWKVNGGLPKFFYD